MTARNPLRGTVPCPIGGCSLVCEVRQFKHQTTTDNGRRKAGKFYFDCREHGRFGFDGAPAMQEYVLERIQWAEGQGEQGASASSSEPAPPREQPKPPPAPVKPAPISSGASRATAPVPARKKAWWEHL